MKIIQLTNIEKRYRNIIALKKVNILFKANSINLLLGPNGAGKTTLLKIILNQIYRYNGSLRNDFSKIGYMPELNFGNEKWNIEKYLYYLACLQKISKNELENIKSNLLNNYIDISFMKKKFNQMSKGMKQIAKWCLSIAFDPELLILDEPISGLDPVSQKKMKIWIKKANKTGKTIIISTHLLNEMEDIGDNYFLIDKGIIIDNGLLDELLKSSNLETHFFTYIKDKG